jgi:two-component system chemotaxis sensor kinase CheA
MSNPIENHDAAFLKRLQAMFRIEAEEHIHIISSGLMELEKNPKAKGVVEITETIYREAHSLKGAARSVDRNDIEILCQALESIFSKLKTERFGLTAKQFDFLYETLDIVLKLSTDKETLTSDAHQGLIKQLQTILNSELPQKKPGAQPSISVKHQGKYDDSTIQLNKVPGNKSLKEEKSYIQTIVRVPSAKLDPLFLQAEQMIQFKIAASQWMMDLKKLFGFIRSWKEESGETDTKDSSRIELQLKEIISRNNKKLNELEYNISGIVQNIDSEQRLLGRMVDEHLESMKEILMLPVSTMVEGFPKLVRDLARSQNKEAELVINGQEIEVDKRILEDLKDPLIHLIRNCIDHGIEKPEERIKKNKPAYGTITIEFSATEGHHLETDVSDNGSGINTENVVQAAIKAGILSKEDTMNLSYQDILALIYKSGISTKPVITDISGRGLGLAIVSEKVEKLGGIISVETRMNGGTTFRISLPLSLSMYRGILVKAGERLFLIPTIYVERVIRVNKENIRTVENRETIAINRDIISVVKLSDALGLNGKSNLQAPPKGGKVPDADYAEIVILKQGEIQRGFLVDEILDEHEILVKELGRQLKYVRNISGATVLGSGTVVPVINVFDLMKSGLSNRKDKSEAGEEILTRRTARILVTEDSITSRTLIRDILESSGYQVETAVDGIDGYTKALAGDFDLIVSDVDMPRMNGFDLTSKIRKNKKLGDMPVILVTALESREDKEHGIDVGANAYIIKSSFDQSNLLEVVKRLL